MQQSNPLSPLRMTPSQRLSEVAGIIAQAIIRLRSPDSNSPPLLDSDSDISLAMPAYRSVHGEPENNANIQEKK